MKDQVRIRANTSLAKFLKTYSPAFFVSDGEEKRERVVTKLLHTRLSKVQVATEKYIGILSEKPIMPDFDCFVTLIINLQVRLFDEKELSLTEVMYMVEMVSRFWIANMAEYLDDFKIYFDTAKKRFRSKNLAIHTAELASNQQHLTRIRDDIMNLLRRYRKLKDVNYFSKQQLWNYYVWFAHHKFFIWTKPLFNKMHVRQLAVYKLLKRDKKVLKADKKMFGVLHELMDNVFKNYAKGVPNP